MKFIEIIKTIISEQTESWGGFKKGDVLRAKRDKDGGDYELIVISVEDNRRDGTISVKSLNGKGKYKDRVLDGREQHEVDLRQKNYISGVEPELGKFTNIKKTSSGGSSTSTTTTGGDRDPGMSAGRASKTGGDYGPATTAVKGATADEKAMMNKGKAVKSSFN